MSAQNLSRSDAGWLKEKKRGNFLKLNLFFKLFSLDKEAKLNFSPLDRSVISLAESRRT